MNLTFDDTIDVVTSKFVVVVVVVSVPLFAVLISRTVEALELDWDVILLDLEEVEGEAGAMVAMKVLILVRV